MEKRDTSPTPAVGQATSGRRIYVVIPAREALTHEESETVGSGGAYPVHVSEYLPEHESFLDYLIDASFDDWARAAGRGR